MLLVWDKRVFEKVDCAVGCFSVNVFLGVYGPNGDNQWGALWEELTRMHSRWNTTWCVLGDFNTIRYPSERFGCEAFSLAMFAFLVFKRLITLWTYPLKGLRLLGLEIRG